ncbi:MAG: hypothetical protein KDD34_00555 [Bdellovibrionales bacterium]|nr:hypothetical protein [Bdellovibrionales bacterium]
MNTFKSTLTLKVMFFLALAFIAFVSLNKFFLTTETMTNQRHPASLGKHDHHLLANNALSLKYTKKLIGPLRVKIQLKGNTPQYVGDRYLLQAIISTSAETKNVHIKWSVPPSSEVISGETDAVVSEMLPGEERIFEILLEQAVNENSQIHVIVQGENAASQYAQTDQFNSLDQETIDRSISALQERAKADIEKTKLAQ